ncbi:MAG: TetR/AcrR family transcriptional regulator [Balneolaceae bacterium]|nr:TetR/AcrR family transcriptional regulator [Balneolaceae bacterium]
MKREKETEEKIFDAAKKVFQRSGYAGARMQDIADEADINKSMLHYYFRSKDKLFQAVLQERMRKFFPKIQQALGSDKPLDRKIEELVDTYYGIFKENPYLPSFVILEMNQHPARFREMVRSNMIEIPDRFLDQIRNEVEKGNIRPVDPRDFLINTIALCVFPFMARPMIQQLFGMEEGQFLSFISNRKEELPAFILNTVRKDTAS